MVASIKSHNKGESMKRGNNSVSGKVSPNLEIVNKELQNILNKIVKYILNQDLYIALGVGGSYSTGENVDIYSDLDMFLIVDAPKKDFKTIIKQISNLFEDDIFVIKRGDVKYLGYVYNFIFSSLTYLDLFINNKVTFESCYLTHHMKILFDKDGWLTKVKNDSVSLINDGYSILSCKSYDSFIIDSIKLLHSIKRNEFLDSFFYTNRIIDSLLYLVRIDANKLGGHPNHPRSHFEAEITSNIDFSDLCPSYYIRKKNIYLKKLFKCYFDYLDKISDKYPVKRNAKIEKNIISEFSKAIGGGIK